MLWRFLKQHAGTEAKRVITATSEDNGREAWHKLHEMYEPAMAMRQAQVMAQFTGMVNKRVKNVN